MEDVEGRDEKEEEEKTAGCQRVGDGLHLRKEQIGLCVHARRAGQQHGQLPKGARDHTHGVICVHCPSKRERERERRRRVEKDNCQFDLLCNSSSSLVPTVTISPGLTHSATVICIDIPLCCHVGSASVFRKKE